VLIPRAVAIHNSTENAELLDLATLLLASMPGLANTSSALRSESDTSLPIPASMFSFPSAALTALQEMGMDGLLELGFGDQNIERCVWAKKVA
jgi:hypothetical protein